MQAYEALNPMICIGKHNKGLSSITFQHLLIIRAKATRYHPRWLTMTSSPRSRISPAGTSPNRVRIPSTAPA